MRSTAVPQPERQLVHEGREDPWLKILLAQPYLRYLLLQEASAGAPVGLGNSLLGERVVLAQLVTPLSRVHEHASALRAGICLPVGSSDFVRTCMQAAGIDEPQWDCYPSALVSHMLGHPRKVHAHVALKSAKPLFVKAALGSPFRAFVARDDSAKSSSWEKSQLDRLLDLPRATPVWISRVLSIAAQWRFYILDGEILGYAPSNPVGYTRRPGIDEVSSIVAAAPIQGAFALDIAVLKNGTTTLLCARDAWTVEWYPHGSDTPKPLAFLYFLWTRWSELLLEPRQTAANHSIL